MKKTTLALLLSAVVAMPVMAQDFAVSNDIGATKDKSGFALTGGIVHYNDRLGKAIERLNGSENVFQLGADYTFSKGFILGLTSTAMQELDGDVKVGVASFFGGYELDCGVRLKAGFGLLVQDSPRFSGSDAGLMLGLGYAFDNGIIVEGGYNSVQVGEDDDSEGNFKYTSVSVGYKF